MFSIVPLYPWCVCSIMAQSRDRFVLSFSSLCLLLVCWERRRERVRKEEDKEGAGDWTQSLHTQLKESSALRHSLATYVLTFVFLSVVIYGTMELKAKLAAAQHQRGKSNVGWARIVREDQAVSMRRCLVVIVRCYCESWRQWCPLTEESKQCVPQSKKYKWYLVHFV